MFKTSVSADTPDNNIKINKLWLSDNLISDSLFYSLFTYKYNF
jgi:hypothetical protein